MPKLLRRGDQFYFRLRVPSDLAAHYSPKRELTFSLRTSDRREAQERQAEHYLRVQREFAQARLRINAASSDGLTEAAIKQIGEARYAEILHNDRVWRIEDKPHVEEREALELVQTDQMEELDEEIQSYRPSARTLRDLERFLRARGLKLPSETFDRDALGLEFAQATLRALTVVLQRNASGLDATSLDVPPESLQAAVLRIPALLEKWRLERKPIARTYSDWLRAVNRFTSLVGDLPLSQIKKAHAVVFKDDLVRQGLNPKTINEKYLTALSSLFNYADRNDLAQSNPFRGVRALEPKVKEHPRHPFELADLQRIFGSAVYTKGLRMKGGRGDAQFWLPLLALFTGARLEELAALPLVAVKVLNGVTHFEILDRDDGGRLKNEGSRRRVPVHPELRRLGFLAYVSRRRKAGRTMLFDFTPSKKNGTYSAPWGQWFGRYLRGAVEIADRKKTFHSFRHTFKFYCRQCGIPEEAHDALTGHTNNSIGRQYGGALGYPIDRLEKAMKKYRIQGLRILPRADDK